MVNTRPARRANNSQQSHLRLIAHKAAVFRTLEALIAIFITFLFLLVFIPQVRENAQPQTPQNVLVSLRENDDFRNCVIQKNQTCLNQLAGKNIEGKYEFLINVSDNPNAIVSGLPPKKRVFANSLYISGNTTNATSTVVRLYFWTK